MFWITSPCLVILCLSVLSSTCLLEVHPQLHQISWNCCESHLCSPMQQRDGLIPVSNVMRHVISFCGEGAANVWCNRRPWTFVFKGCLSLLENASAKWPTSGTMVWLQLPQLNCDPYRAQIKNWTKCQVQCENKYLHQCFTSLKLGFSWGNKLSP